MSRRKSRHHLCCLECPVGWEAFVTQEHSEDGDERVGGEANCVKDRDESETMREDSVTQCHAQHRVTQPDH